MTQRTNAAGIFLSIFAGVAISSIVLVTVYYLPEREEFGGRATKGPLHILTF